MVVWHFFLKTQSNDYKLLTILIIRDFLWNPWGKKIEKQNVFNASNPCTRIQVMSTCSQGLVSFFLPQSVQCVCVLCACCVCGCREWCIVGWNKMRADRSWRKTLVTHGEAAEQPMESRSMQQRGGEQPGKSREHRGQNPPPTCLLCQPLKSN